MLPCSCWNPDTLGVVDRRVLQPKRLRSDFVRVNIVPKAELSDRVNWLTILTVGKSEMGKRSNWVVPTLLEGKSTSAFGVPWHSVISASSTALIALDEIRLDCYICWPCVNLAAFSPSKFSTLRYANISRSPPLIILPPWSSSMNSFPSSFV